MVPICLYCLNGTESGQLILRKIIKIVATSLHQMSDFKAKMHQIRFSAGAPPQTRLGLRLRHGWGSLQRSARPPKFDFGNGMNG